jgi:hypothetical protein
MISVFKDLTKRNDAMAPSDVAIQEAHEIVRQKSAEDPSLPATVAEFFQNSNAQQTIRAVLIDNLQPPIFHDGRYTVLLDLFRNLRLIQLPREKLFLLSMNILTKLAIDAQATNVPDSFNSGGAAVSDSNAQQPEQGSVRMEDSEKQRRRALASKLGLPSFREAMKAVGENQRVSFDPKNRLPEEFTDKGGAWSLKIPRHNR